MAGTTDMQQVFFTNLQLLGFDCDAMERKLRIPFKPDMFNLPNKKGFEVIMYYLFNKLDPVKCREIMRDCWPVDSKTREQAFRRAVNNWLATIEKEDPDSHLPRITASLFMSPGGDRFYQLLLCFTRYVMFKLSVKENGIRRQNFLRFPMLTPNASHLGETVATAIKCGAVRERGKFLDHTMMVTAMQDEWRRYAAELVKTNRALSKEIRSLDKQIKEEQQKSSDGGLARGSPMRRNKGAGMVDYDYNIQKVKRAQKVQKVRDQWKTVDDFYANQKEEREIVESILEGTMEKYKIDANELNVKVPDLLLRECEREIQRRNVDNIYQGGKVNLVSLVHLWNLSLHLYIEKLHQTGLPNVDEAIPELKTQIRAHHAEFVNAQALNTKLESYLVPELQNSIRSLQRRLDEKMAALPKSPHSMASRGTGLSFLPPTPPLNLEPTSATKTPGELKEVPSKAPSPYKESTPEAASRLIDSITNSVRSEHASLHQGSPLFGRGDSMRGLLPQQTSRLHQRVEDVRGRTRVHSAPQGLGSSWQGSKVPETGSRMEPLPGEQLAKLAKTAQVTRHISKTGDKDPNVFKVPTAAMKPKKRPHKSVHPKVERHTDMVASITHSSSGGSELNTSSPRGRASDRSPRGKGRSPHVKGGDRSTASGQDHGLQASSPLGQDLETIPGERAFMSRERVTRTPQTKPAWQEEEEGPLSSTRIEANGREPVDRQQVQRVAQQLFSPEVSDTEDHIVTVSSPQRPIARDSPLRARISEPSPQQVARLERLESEMLRSCSPISQKHKVKSEDDDLEMPSSISDANSPRSVRSDFSQRSVRSDLSRGSGGLEVTGVGPLSDSVHSHGEPAHGQSLPLDGQRPAGLPMRASGDGMPAREVTVDHSAGGQSLVQVQQAQVESSDRNVPTDNLLGLDMGDAEDIVNSIMNGTPEDPLGLAREFDDEFNATHPAGAVELLPATEVYHELQQTATPQLPKRSRPVNPGVNGSDSLHGDDNQSGLGYGVAEYANVPERFTRTTGHVNPRLSTDEKMFLLESMSQDVSKVNSLLQDSLRGREVVKQPPLVENDEQENGVFNTTPRNVSSTAQPLIELQTMSDKSGGSSHHSRSGTKGRGSVRSQPVGSPAAPTTSQSETDYGTTDQEEENVRAISFRNGEFSEIIEKSPAKRGVYFVESRKDNMAGHKSPHSSLHSSLNRSQNSSTSTASHQLLDELYTANLQAQGVREEEYRDDQGGHHDNGSGLHGNSTDESSQGSVQNSPSSRLREVSSPHGNAPIEDFLSADVDSLIARYRQIRLQATELPSNHPLPRTEAPWEPSDSMLTDTNLISLSDTQGRSHPQRQLNGTSNDYGMVSYGQDPFSPPRRSGQPTSLVTTVVTKRRGSLQDFITSPPGEASPLEREVFPEMLASSPGFPLSPRSSPTHPPLLSTLPMSPHTDKLHDSDVQFNPRRLTDQWDNIMSQGDSLLVTSSEGEED